MGKLLAIDLDGTLFYPKQKRRYVPKKNVEFLREFIDAGNKVVLVSSRGIDLVKKVADEIGRNVSIMSSTTSQIFVDGKMIRNETIDRESLKDLFEYLGDKPKAYLMTTSKYPLIIKQVRYVPKFLIHLYHLYWVNQGPYREPYVIDNKIFDEELEKGDIYKVMVFYGLGRDKREISKELNKVIRENHKNIESAWTICVNEITPANCNKAAGLEYLIKHENIDENDVYVVGDSGNDISMFNRFYEHSFVMAHAYPSVKKYAKHCVKRVFNIKDYVLKGE